MQEKRRGLQQMENNEKLLEVEHLKQYFKIGPRTVLKAVDDISFDVYKGEVFGIVGESGCGKTTTGRSIIKLYQPSSGYVRFKGQVISAGTLDIKKKISNAKKARAQEIAALDKQDSSYVEKKKAICDKYTDVLIQYGKELTDAKWEQKHGTEQYIKDQIEKVHAEFEPKLAKFSAVSESERAAKVQERTKKIESATQKLNDTKAAKTQELATLNPEDANYAENKKQINEKYDSLLAECKTALKDAKWDEETELKKEYSKQLRLAKKNRLMTKMQMIFQDPIASLDPRMTVYEIIAEGLIIRGIRDKKYITEKVNEVLKMVGLLPEHASRYPHEFSGGQRQRIGIARAIIMEPELIIADEPISALDVSIQAQVMNLLNDLRNKMNLTIVFIAHNLSVVKYFSDRIAVMYFGKIVELTTSKELFEHPLHPYTKSLLSAIPLPDPDYEKKRKRIVYDPVVTHNYSVDLPSLREIKPGHWIYCNDEEFENYKKELK